VAEQINKMDTNDCLQRLVAICSTQQGYIQLFIHLDEELSSYKILLLYIITFTEVQIEGFIHLSQAEYNRYCGLNQEDVCGTENSNLEEIYEQFEERCVRLSPDWWQARENFHIANQTTFYSA
jgi:hypothetical protein